MEQLLKNKVAVVYGAGPIGSAVSKAFAAEGATVYLVAHSERRTKSLAEKINTAGGKAITAIADVLNKESVDAVIQKIVDETGRLDISFCATNFSEGKSEQGLALSEIDYEIFSTPMHHFLKSQFLTTQAAARQMTKQKSGVLLMITAIPSRMPIPYTTGFGPAWAAMEAMSRTLAAELGSLGIRSVVLHSAGSPEAQESIDSTFSKRPEVETRIKEWKFIHRNLLNRWPTLAEVGNMAAFMVSDKASVTTAAMVNLTGGMTDL